MYETYYMKKKTYKTKERKVYLHSCFANPTATHFKRLIQNSHDRKLTPNLSLCVSIVSLEALETASRGIAKAVSGTSF